MSENRNSQFVRAAGDVSVLGLGAEDTSMPGSDQVLNVFFTVDTEVYPITCTWRKNRLRHDIDRDIYGRVATGDYGLTYQLEILRKYDLKGSFFVEPLFALSEDVGEEPLRRIIQEVQAAGQEVQMHLHPEWVPELPTEIVGALAERKSDVLNRFNASDQVTLIHAGLEALRRCGAQEVRAFRAGDYAADFRTLQALGEVGLEFDTSYNYCYLKSLCGLRTPEPIFQPMRIKGLWEIPICCFRDWPGHLRHTQLGACSSAEMVRALETAKRAGWWSFVIVSHSFELLKNRRSTAPVSVRPGVVARFERLCAFLDRNRDRFRTEHFSAIDVGQIPTGLSRVPLDGCLTETLGRLAEQLYGRLS